MTLSSAVVLTTALLLVVAASADAAVRFTSPTGTNSGASCPEIDPCSLIAAVDPAFTADGDDVVLAPGDYDVGGTMLLIGEAVELYSIGLPSQVTISSSSGTGILVGHENARVAGVTVEHTGIGTGVSVNQGTLENSIVTSTAGSGCGMGGDTLIRDSICVTSAANRGGLQLSTSGGPANTVLRNVTAIGTGINSRGLDLQSGTSATVMIDARAVIARGVAGDVRNVATDTGVVSQIVMTNSNFDTVTTDDFGGTATATVTADNTNGNQSTAPVFVNAGLGDYHQHATSPTIDAGGAADADTGVKDIDNDARTIGPAVDIGADELDNVAPDAPVIDSPVDGTISTDTTPTVSGTAELNTLVKLFVDGALNGNGSANGITGAFSLTTNVLADGTYELSATSTDAGGNESDPGAVDYTVDTTAPVVSITAPADSAAVSDDTPAVSFTLTEDNPGSTTCTVDGGTPFACSSGDSMPTLSDGSHTVEVVHTDDVSQTGNDSVTFTVDTTAPTVSITAPADAALVSDNTPAVSFTLTEDNPGSTTCTVDGGTPFACSSGDSMPTLADGSHTVQVVHTDDAAQTGNDSVTFTVDTTAPIVQITVPTASAFVSENTPTITFAVTEANPDSTMCQVDGGSLFACVSGASLPALADGAHTLTVVHNDQVGLTGSATRSFTTDTTPPVVTISAPVAGSSTNDSSPTVEFSITEANPGATTCSVNGGAAAPCSSGQALAPIADGTQTLAIAHTDAAGLSATATVSFTVDATPPQTKISKKPKRKVKNRKVSFTFSSSEPGSTFLCKIDKGKFVPCKSKLTKKLKPGKHKFSVVAIDRQGNRDTSPATCTFTIVNPKR